MRAMNKRKDRRLRRQGAGRALGIALGLALGVACARGETNVMRHLRLGYAVQNRSADLVPLAELWVRAPLARTPWQRCGTPAATRAFVLEAAADGGQLLRFAFTNFPPFASEVVWVDVDVQLAPAPAAEAAPAAPALLAASAPFDFQDPAFAPVLRAITGRRPPPPAELGTRIVRWVGERVRADSYSAGQRGALDALRDGRGDCSERMALTVALCRSAGLPARGVGGVNTARDRVVRASDFHDWSVYHDGACWRLADPGARAPVSWEHYVAFEWIDGSLPQTTAEVRRFRAAGAGVVARME